MFLVKKDIKQNRLFITISGVISISDAVQIKEIITKDVEELEPGFDCINDISKLIRGDDSSGPILQWVINFLLEKKVECIVRIIGPSKTGLMQFAKNSPEKANSRIKYVPTVKEAKKILNELKAAK